MAECDNCIHESEIQELKKDMERNSTAHREFYDSFKKLEVKQGVADNTISNIFSVMNEIKDDVKELKDKPIKKWDSVTTYAITALIGGIIGYIISVIL